MAHDDELLKRMFSSCPRRSSSLAARGRKRRRAWRVCWTSAWSRVGDEDGGGGAVEPDQLPLANLDRYPGTRSGDDPFLGNRRAVMETRSDCDEETEREHGRAQHAMAP
jgi:hypothetical protein